MIKIIFTIFLGFGVIGQTFSQDYNWDELYTNRALRMKFNKNYKYSTDGKNLIRKHATKTRWWINSCDPTKTTSIGGHEDSVAVLFDSKWFGDSMDDGFNYSFSKDGNYLLLLKNPEFIYRHSYSSEIEVYNLRSKTYQSIPGRVLYPELSPNNEWLAYVRDNNLFIYHLATNKETAITNNGEKNKIINGAVDWVYEEEFSMSKGYEWSAEGNFIAFYIFDESKVKQFSMDVFKGLYPQQEVWKYPKAGEDNSKVSVGIYSVKEQSTSIPNFGQDNDQYLPRIQWLQEDNQLCVQRLNRHQNHWEVILWDWETQKPEVIIEETDNAYVEVNDEFTLIPNCNEFLFTSERSGYNHIYSFDYNKKKLKQITTGDWQVNNLLGYNESTEKIYYTSTEKSTVADAVYEISLKGKNKKLVIEKAGDGNQSVSASANAVWMQVTVSNFSHNPTAEKYIIKNGAVIDKEVDQNYIDTLKGKNPGKVEFSELYFADDDKEPYSLNCWMMYPNNFDSTKKYPLLMYVYGGPGNSVCRNSASGYFHWYQHLASQGYIIACVDNRGTGNKGANFKKSTYLNLGKLEHQDQTKAAQFFGNMSYIDSDRIGIWGWSFGGYMSSLCISKSPNTFKTAIAVAPVTHWKFYDNIYTERYLRTPQENPRGYEDNSPLNFVESIKGNYLIVHGTADDNVHFQNGVEMINSMISKRVRFDSEIYPNRAHGISDLNARLHLFDRLTRYIKSNL
ncbi:MAG: S9 family peptidase [Bacteroidia bacterium]